MSIFQRLITIDRRILYIAMVLAVTFPMLHPIGFPVEEQQTAVSLYEYIDTVPAGWPIIFSADCGANSISELRPMWEVLIDLSLQKKHRIITMALWPEGEALAQIWSAKAIQRHQAVYGQDYIHLGYMPSYQTFYDLGREDLLEACNGGTDYQGQTLGGFPIMKGIHAARDIKAVISFGAGDPGVQHWVQNWYATSDVQVILACQTATSYPYARSATLAAGNMYVSGGSGGAATLERCHGVIGLGHRESDAQSLGHLAIILFILLGNIGYTGARLRGEIALPATKKTPKWKRIDN